MKKTDKLIVLGIDGMDPMFTKYLLDKGELPAVKKIIDEGACRDDLMMIGGMPTITPPMWTTLSWLLSEPTAASPALQTLPAKS